MVKYKVNLKFKDTSISLNEIITKVLKLKFNTSYNYLNKEILSQNSDYFGIESSGN